MLRGADADRRSRRLSHADRFLYEPIGRLHQLNQLVQAGRAAGERVFEILDEPEEPGLANGDAESAEIAGDIRYEDVSFSLREEACRR